MDKKSWKKWKIVAVGLSLVLLGAFWHRHRQAQVTQVIARHQAELAQMLHTEGLRQQQQSRRPQSITVLSEAYRLHRESLGRFNPKTYASLEALAQDSYVVMDSRPDETTNALALFLELKVATTNVFSGDEAQDKLADIEMKLSELYAKLNRRQESQGALRRSYRLQGMTDQENDELAAGLKSNEEMVARTEREIAPTVYRIQKQAEREMDELMKELVEASRSGEFQTAMREVEEDWQFQVLESADESSCRQAWTNLNKTFEDGAGLSMNLYGKRLPSQHVFALKAEQNSRFMAMAALNFKGFFLDREMRLQRALARSANPEIVAWRKQLAGAELHTLQFQDMMRREVKERNGMQQWFADLKQTQEAWQAEWRVRQLALAIPGAHRREMTLPERVTSVLPPRSVLVELLHYARATTKNGEPEVRYGAAVLAGGQAVRWVPLAPASEVNSLVERYGEILGRKDPADAETLHEYDAELQFVLSSLHKKVWRDVAATFPADTTTVFVSPDAELHKVSFATLSDKGRLLGQDYEFRYLMSGRDLTGVNPPLTTNRTIHVFSDPDVTKGDSGWRAGAERLVRLPQAIYEARALETVARRLKGVQVVAKSGANVTESSIAKVDSPLVVHFGMHGVNKPMKRRPPDSELVPIEAAALLAPLYRGGLALTGANRDLEAWPADRIPTPKADGVLMPVEAASLNLEGTWLATLATCSSGIGGVVEGEGNLCLKHGLLQAGAQHVLFTLWSIDSSYTALLLERFYEQAFRSGDPPAALFAVQRDELLKLSNGSDANSLWKRVRLAGPFVVVSQGQQKLQADLAIR